MVCSVTVVMLAITTGTVIDAFGASRDQRNDVEKDQKVSDCIVIIYCISLPVLLMLQNNCFVCSIEGSRFDRLGRGFTYHTSHEHNCWQYIYLLVSLPIRTPGLSTRFSGAGVPAT
jgi:hypothetical protein